MCDQKTIFRKSVSRDYPSQRIHKMKGKDGEDSEERVGGPCPDQGDGRSERERTQESSE